MDTSATATTGTPTGALPMRSQANAAQQHGQGAIPSGWLIIGRAVLHGARLGAASTGWTLILFPILIVYPPAIVFFVAIALFGAVCGAVAGFAAGCVCGPLARRGMGSTGLTVVTAVVGVVTVTVFLTEIFGEPYFTGPLAFFGTVPPIIAAPFFTQAVSLPAGRQRGS